MAATISRKSSRRAKRSGVRPIDPLRDLPTIVELIALGFAEELDPQGEKMLAHMRRVARYRPLAYLMSDPDVMPKGFVWAERGRVVGNLSLRHATPGRRRGQMIGNVVVHPDYRGRGIGRALMEAAIGAARAEHARWIGLEVREGNAVACGLYEHLGFRAMGRTRHMVRSEGLPWPQGNAPARGTWHASKPDDNLAWNTLAEAIYGEDQAQLLEIYPGMFRYGGWERRMSLWLSGRRERAWLSAQARPRLAVRVRTERWHRFHLWDLLVHPAAGSAGARAAVCKAVAETGRFPPWPAVTMVQDQAPLVDALREVGFALHRSLLQMLLVLD